MRAALSAIVGKQERAAPESPRSSAKRRGTLLSLLARWEAGAPRSWLSATVGRQERAAPAFPEPSAKPRAADLLISGVKTPG